MRYDSIFIANLAETAAPLLKYFSEKEREREVFEDHALCDRFLFSDQDNRVLVTPFPINKQLARDACKLLGFKNIINLRPRNVGVSLSKAVVQDKKLFLLIVSLIKRNPGIAICSYTASYEFRGLINLLKKQNLIFSTPEMPAEKGFWTAEFFGSKAGFRQLAGGLPSHFPAMPQGAIVDNIHDLAGWAEYFLNKRKGVVIKTNRGLAGAGLAIIKRADVKNKNISQYVPKTVKGKLFWRKTLTVVEEYIEPAGALLGREPNVEARVREGGVEILYTCNMRVDASGAFKGVEIGKEALPYDLDVKLISAGKILGRIYHKYGYRGYFDIDFVFGKNGRLYALESNVRRTGGTHAFELARRLLGDDFPQNYYLVSNNVCPTERFKGKSYAELKKATGHLFYPMDGKKEGVVLTVANYLPKGNLGYVVISRNKQRTIEIESDFLKLL